MEENELSLDIPPISNLEIAKDINETTKCEKKIKIPSSQWRSYGPFSLEFRDDCKETGKNGGSFFALRKIYHTFTLKCIY